IRLRVNSWRPARLYQYEYRKKGTEQWSSVMHTKSSLEMRNLDMLEEYEFRVSYIGRDVRLNYSDLITAWVIGWRREREYTIVAACVVVQYHAIIQILNLWHALLLGSDPTFVCLQLPSRYAFSYRIWSGLPCYLAYFPCAALYRGCSCRF